MALQEPESGPVADRIAAELVRAGLVREQDRAAASRVVANGIRDAGVAPPPPAMDPSRAEPEHGSLRRRVAEVAGYLGAALVLVAVGLFVSQQWSALAHGARVAVLAVTAAALAAAGAGLATRLTVPRRDAGQTAAGRLAAVLLGAAAVAAGFAVGVAAPGPGDGVWFGVSLLVAGLLGYLAVPSSVGQLTAAAGAVVLVRSVLQQSDVAGAVLLGLLLVVLGVGWLLLGERGLWRPVVTARVLGCLIAFAGAQLPVSGSHPWVGYVVTGVLAVGAFAAYVLRRAWVYLVLGVLATTVAVPEAVADWTDGSLGAAGALLVAGLALLGASLAGLRLRREVTGPATGDRVP